MGLMMVIEVTGCLLIGAEEGWGAGAGFRAVDPACDQEIEPEFRCADDRQIDLACDRAAGAFDAYRSLPVERRADFLECIALELERLGESIVARAMLETGLPRPRLAGELIRTTRQLRLFAQEVLRGCWQDATIDAVEPGAAHAPGVDLRRRNIPVGPVAVFGASNFPLAFSVAGGDTASAFAAGCPVVVKAHPAHPGTSELAGKAIRNAVKACQVPAGVFSLVQGNDHVQGERLVKHPAIRAVGFTGSRSGGMALMRHAAARPVPIPVFAEMSSLNPLFLLPQALRTRAVRIAEDFADSLTLGCGQFCTNPGVVIGIAGDDLEAFLGHASAAIGRKSPATMLTGGIHRLYQEGLAHLNEQEGVDAIAVGRTGDGPNLGVAHLYRTTGAHFMRAPDLRAELFGPSSLVVVCASADEMLSIAAMLEGQLTATLQADPADHALVMRLLPGLERLAGRVVLNGFPTGVEVSHAMVHGGPFPATSDGRSTSVGMAAMMRFLRPVCYQNFPDAWMPEPVRDGNPERIWQTRNGQLMAPMS
jgi:NADP-dependent aldehyde dehydrogenase